MEYKGLVYVTALNQPKNRFFVQTLGSAQAAQWRRQEFVIGYANESSARGGGVRGHAPREIWTECGFPAFLEHNFLKSKDRFHHLKCEFFLFQSQT